MVDYIRQRWQYFEPAMGPCLISIPDQRMHRIMRSIELFLALCTGGRFPDGSRRVSGGRITVRISRFNGQRNGQSFGGRKCFRPALHRRDPAWRSWSADPFQEQRRSLRLERLTDATGHLTDTSLHVRIALARSQSGQERLRNERRGAKHGTPGLYFPFGWLHEQPVRAVAWLFTAGQRSWTGIRLHGPSGHAFTAGHAQSLAQVAGGSGRWFSFTPRQVRSFSIAVSHTTLTVAVSLTNKFLNPKKTIE